MNQKEKIGSLGYKSISNGFALGVDSIVKDGLYVGLGLINIVSKITQSDIYKRSTSSSGYQVIAYSSCEQSLQLKNNNFKEWSQKIFIDCILASMSDNNKRLREHESSVARSINYSSYDTVKFNFGSSFYKPAIALSSSASLQYGYLKHSRYSEVGLAGIENIKLKSNSSLILGISSTMKCNRELSGFKFEPELYSVINYDLCEKVPELSFTGLYQNDNFSYTTYKVLSGCDEFTLKGDCSNKYSYNLGVGINVRALDCLLLSIKYDVTTKNIFKKNSLLMNLSYSI